MLPIDQPGFKARSACERQRAGCHSLVALAVLDVTRMRMPTKLPEEDRPISFGRGHNLGEVIMTLRTTCSIAY